MYSPLLQSIIERENWTIVDDESLDRFAGANGDVILFITGDYKRLVEVNDVAVILPEIIKASGGTLTPAIVDRESERDIQRRYRFNAFPSLVFLRDGEYLGVISRVLDWQDYIIEINSILARTPTQPPAFEFPDGCNVTRPDKPSGMVNKLIEKGAENV